MAETVYKKISELPNATLPLAGTEYVELSATGASKRGLWSGLFGSGWWEKLAAAFSAFKAPDSDHSDNADTLGAGLETSTDFHDATQLVGAVPLANIPAELTGKNADTVDTYHAGVGAGKLNPVHGYINSSSAISENTIYDAISPIIPNIGDSIQIHGTLYEYERVVTTDYNVWYFPFLATRVTATQIMINSMAIWYKTGDGTIDASRSYSTKYVNDGGSDTTALSGSLTY